MPYLQLDHADHQLAAGETRVGRGADADIHLPELNAKGDVVRNTVAVIALAPDQSATLRVDAAEGSVFVNGVPVGREPAPLLHGDRLTIEGCELRFADEAQSGDTQEFPAVTSVATATPSAGARDARSRGRIVSLVDGREYAVNADGLTIGRDAICDVVITSPAVSRRHARIELAGDGYAVIDTSTNGVLVNGCRVPARLALGRSDTIRIGSDEFRFYADAEAAAPRLDLAAVPSLQVTAAIPAVKRPVTKTATPPNAAAAAPKGKLAQAVLEVRNEGLLKGMRFELNSSLSHVGRGEYNDVVVPDDSVSDLHAKIQRREDGWWVVDMDSTNGSYIGGERLFAETRLTNGADVRFGGIKMTFRTIGGVQHASGETRVIVGVHGPDPKRSEQRMRELARGAEPPEVPEERERAPKTLWLALLVLAAVVVFLVLQGR